MCDILGDLLPYGICLLKIEFMQTEMIKIKSDFPYCDYFSDVANWWGAMSEVATVDEWSKPTALLCQRIYTAVVT